MSTPTPTAGAAVVRAFGARGDILFNGADDEYPELSNVSRTPIVVGGLVYKTPEHCFQVHVYYLYVRVRVRMRPNAHALFYVCAYVHM